MSLLSVEAPCDERESIEEIEYSVAEDGASSGGPGPSQGPYFLTLFPLVKRGGSLVTEFKVSKVLTCGIWRRTEN